MTDPPLTRFRDNFLPHSGPPSLEYEKDPARAARAAAERRDLAAVADLLLDADSSAVDLLPDTLTMEAAEVIKANLKRFLEAEIAPQRSALDARARELDARERELIQREQQLADLERRIESQKTLDRRQSRLEAAEERLRAARQRFEAERQQVRNELIRCAHRIEHADLGPHLLNIRVGSRVLRKQLSELAETLRSRARQFER